MEQLGGCTAMSYDHVLTILEQEKRVEIYRIFPDGRKELYTSMDLPGAPTDRRRSGFSKIARMLGEALLLDSPVARKLLGL
jgi:hypothetical protein